jgi:hypothetical protein
MKIAVDQLGLANQLRRETPADRAIERSLKAREKLGVTASNMLDMPYYPKPRRRRYGHARNAGDPRRMRSTCLLRGRTNELGPDEVRLTLFGERGEAFPPVVG